MSEQNFTATITVDRSPEQVFAAITNVRGWWSGDIEGKTDALGAEFTYRYQDLHRTTQRITEVVPNRKVVWSIVESYLGFVEDKQEWNGTSIVFDITPVGDKTEVRFTHRGLVPTIACYEKCSRAWTYYITESLRKLIVGA